MGVKALLLGGLLAGLAAPVLAGESWQEPVTGMEFVAIPKGCFQMGLPAKAFEEDGPLFAQRVRHEMPQHEACVDGFWLGRLEVRQADWQKVMGEGSGAAPDLPATGMTWDQANAFAARLGELSGGKERFRLPTEAEWEYACRAGAKAFTGNTHRNELHKQAWYSVMYDQDKPGMRRQDPQPVGQKEANAFGLHDMLGNVWEWVQDPWRADAYAQHALYNPVAAGPGDRRAIRGGSIRSERRLTRCESRAWLPAGEIHGAVGLRLVRVGPGEKK